MGGTRATIGAIGISVGAVGASAAVNHVTFDSGAEGWSINGWDVITPGGGNPGAHINLELPETFGISVRNETNAKWIGDYTSRGPVRISVDFDVEYIRFFGTDVTRDIVLELVDYDNTGDAPYVSVWMNAGALPAPEAGWVTYDFDITDVLSPGLPAGWGGTGAEHPKTFEPMLPAHRSWSDVLAGVDEIRFTTFVPGFFYGFTDFNVSVDNIRMTAVPSPGGAAALGAGLVVAGTRRRR